VKKLQVFKALGCNIDCYSPCYPLNAYVDYAVPYSILDPSTVPNYPVCNNSEIDGLCVLYSYVDQGHSIPSMAIQLSEALPVSVVLEVGSDTNSLRSFLFQDLTERFSHFDIEFSFRTLEGVLGALVFSADSVSLTMGCGDTVEHQLNAYPGTRGLPIFSSTCSSLTLNITVFGELETGMTLYFTVNRYSYRRSWSCDENTTSTNPCEWFGKMPGYNVAQVLTVSFS
jgi:hypothetical protein